MAVKVSEVAPVALISTSPCGMPPIPLKVREPHNGLEAAAVVPNQADGVLSNKNDSFPDSQTATVSFPIVTSTKGDVATADFESVTCKVTDTDPVLPTGRPEITPVLEDKVRPGGSAPVILQV